MMRQFTFLTILGLIATTAQAQLGDVDDERAVLVAKDRGAKSLDLAAQKIDQIEYATGPPPRLSSCLSRVDRHPDLYFDESPAAFGSVSGEVPQWAFRQEVHS